jgi:hypothetical protein
MGVDLERGHFEEEGYIVAVRGWGRRAGRIIPAALVASTPADVETLRERFRRIKHRLTELQLEPAATLKFVGQWRSK